MNKYLKSASVLGIIFILLGIFWYGVSNISNLREYDKKFNILKIDYELPVKNIEQTFEYYKDSLKLNVKRKKISDNKYSFIIGKEKIIFNEVEPSSKSKGVTIKIYLNNLKFYLANLNENKQIEIFDKTIEEKQLQSFSVYDCNHYKLTFFER